MASLSNSKWQNVKNILIDRFTNNGDRVEEGERGVSESVTEVLIMYNSVRKVVGYFCNPLREKIPLSTKRNLYNF